MRISAHRLCKDNHTMKKIVVSAIIIGIFVLYSFIHAQSAPVAVVPNTSPSSSSSSSSAAAPSSTAAPSAPSTSGSLYKDGSYTGSVADAQWGVVQVKAIIQNGKITSVQFLQYPNDHGYSIQVNNYADPQLSSEAIQAQNANVNIITGATLTSEAFMQSLSDALSQAQA